MLVAGSRKRSPIRYTETPIFFSLVDYRNSYFMSNEPEKILEFYDGFDNRDELIRWMKERPKGVANLYEVEGRKNIIVVIPTADFNGRYARNCREEIFKGLHMIFVESGEFPDPYFNFAHNCNVGIIRAMEYDPEWIVVSNDDMYKISPIEELEEELHRIENTEVYLVMTKYPGELHSLTEYVGTSTFIRKAIMSLSPKYRQKYKIEKKFGLRVLTWRDWYGGLTSRLLYKEMFHLKATYSFGIISGYYASIFQGCVFDETYQNGMEDIDLSFRVQKSPGRVSFVNYQIGSYSASTMGTGEFRWLRDLSNKLYFQEKLFGEDSDAFEILTKRSQGV
ncbi:glycosyltransferase family 2 protein [Thermogymnomonas acidicola]|nr:hypothetical protein [Thermogymnomonas acidicola]